MYKAIFSIVGFLLFITGLLALVLTLVGIQLSFLTWIDAPGKLFGLIIRLVMIMLGIITVVLARTDWREEE